MPKGLPLTQGFVLPITSPSSYRSGRWERLLKVCTLVLIDNLALPAPAMKLEGQNTIDYSLQMCHPIVPYS